MSSEPTVTDERVRAALRRLGDLLEPTIAQAPEEARLGMIVALARVFNEVHAEHGAEADQILSEVVKVALAKMDAAVSRVGEVGAA
jgi:hypothetical protein